MLIVFRRWLSSPRLLPCLLLLLAAATLVFLWALYFQQRSSACHEALAAKSAEHLNIATIVAQNLRLLVDRAQAVGNVARADMPTAVDNYRSLVRLLADDTVFKAMALYDLQGGLLSASHAGSVQQLSAARLEQLRAHVERYGFTALLQGSEGLTGDASMPTGRLPFMLPLVDVATGKLQSILVVQLDTGYLATLFRPIDLGRSGLLRLLDAQGHERLRIASGGEVVTVAGDAGALYQDLYSRVPQRGFSVVVGQARDEILMASRQASQRQLWLNLCMTLLVVVGVMWVLRLLGKRQETFAALQQAQQANQQLIARLEAEHQRSSLAAATDHLSGLHNRRRFLEIAPQALLDQAENGQLLAILFIDMDRFKSINDSLGHRVGDLLLQAVAGRIKGLLEPGDEASRFGGDEFVVLLLGERSERQVDLWVRALVDGLTVTYELDGHRVDTSPSVGVSVWPRDGQDIDTLLRGADAAMYSAKRAGRGQYRFHEASQSVLVP